MATGTGKTFIAFQVCWKLWNARWNRNGDNCRPRILYLSDRNILVDDSKDRMFTPFGEARWKIEGEANMSREMYFSTYQSIAEDERRPGLYKEYPVDFFDLVVVDECHRGSARDESSWREILEYFKPAYQLGMTATPLRDDNRDTSKYFGDPLYTYSLKQGIEDGFLAPYRAYHIVTNVDAAGWRPTKGEVDKYGKEIPDAIYGTKELESIVAANEMQGWSGEVARFLVAMYPYTGLRYNELRLALLEDLDTEEWTIFVRHPKGEKRYSRQRTAPILPPARAAFLRFLDARTEHLRAKGVERTEALIPVWRDGRFDFYSYTQFRNIKGEIEKRVSQDGKPVRFHIKTFRDTYCQMNIDRDPSLLSQVSVSMGHATTLTTEESYGRVRRKRSVTDLNRYWETDQVPRYKKPLIDEKCEASGQ